MAAAPARAAHWWQPAAGSCPTLLSDDEHAYEQAIEHRCSAPGSGGCGDVSWCAAAGVPQGTGYRSSEAELSAVRAEPLLGHATKPSTLPAALTPTTHR